MNIEKENILVDTETLKKEQEDLLVLLADQDCRIDQYKKKLKELGELVSILSFLCFSSTFFLPTQFLFNKNYWVLLKFI